MSVSDSVIHAVAGGAAGCISMSTVEAIKKVLADEGLAGLYSGLSSSIVGIAATNTVFYLFFEESKAILLRAKARRAGGTSITALSTLESMLSSTIAGAATTLLTNPIWVVQTYQATRSIKRDDEKSVAEQGQSSTLPEQNKNRKKQVSMIEAAREILEETGVKGLWKGIGPALVLVINPVLQYTAFEQFAKLLATWRRAQKTGGTAVKATASRSLLSDFDMFLLGALSKLLATGITYPYVLVKSRLQASTHKYANSFRAVLDIIKEEGVSGLYRGIGAKLTQSVLTAAFLFVAQRRVFELVKMLLQLRVARKIAV